MRGTETQTTKGKRKGTLPDGRNLILFFRRGGSESILFTCSMLLFLWIFSLGIQLLALMNQRTQMAFALQEACQEIVVQKDLDSAREVGQEVITTLLIEQAPVVIVSSAEVNIDYNSGSEAKWKKGAFLDVELTVVNQLTGVTLKGYQLCMVERSETVSFSYESPTKDLPPSREYDNGIVIE